MLFTAIPNHSNTHRFRRLFLIFNMHLFWKNHFSLFSIIKSLVSMPRLCRILGSSRWIPFGGSKLPIELHFKFLNFGHFVASGAYGFSTQIRASVIIFTSTMVFGDEGSCIKASHELNLFKWCGENDAFLTPKIPWFLVCYEATIITRLKLANSVNYS